MTFIGMFRFPRQDWVGDAVCPSVDPELFHPPKGESSRDAKRICHSCPVEAQCLDYALEHRERGIWGGTSDRDRSKMRTHRRAA